MIAPIWALKETRTNHEFCYIRWCVLLIQGTKHNIILFRESIGTNIYNDVLRYPKPESKKK